MSPQSNQRSRETLESYRSRESARMASAAEARRVENLLSIARLLVFFGTVAAGVLVLFRPLFPPALLLIPAALFMVLVIVHDRRMRQRRRAERGAGFYRRGIARIEFEPAAEPDLTKAAESHLYAGDLDILGPNSLYERICVARTQAGRKCLEDWLLEPAAPAVIRLRQEALLELSAKLDLREDLAALGEESGARVDPKLLLSWATGPRLLTGKWQPWVAAVLSVCTLTSLTGWLAGWATAIPFLATGWIAAGFAAFYAKRVQAVLGGVYGPEHDLALLSELLRRLEQESFDSPYLKQLRESIGTGQGLASARIRTLQRWVLVADSRKSMLVAPIAVLLFFGTQVAFALERWRERSGAHVGEWVAAVAEFESLASLAAFYTEHPSAMMPTVLDAESPGAVRGEQMVHPLLRDCVPNDLDLGASLRLLMVSGSNMSGKSTWLRTIGTNVALAQAGGPVCAGSLTLTPVTVGAAMRIADSLQRGMSHFYAEIQRLRQVVEATSGERPVLFLLDEILHGTNSHDRRIGAEGVIRELLQSGALGLVTTHDLALAAIADELGDQAKNIHFEDHLENGEMKFDFKVRKGVVTKSNALELMRSVGLSV